MTSLECECMQLQGETEECFLCNCCKAVKYFFLFNKLSLAFPFLPFPLSVLFIERLFHGVQPQHRLGVVTELTKDSLSCYIELKVLLL